MFCFTLISISLGWSQLPILDHFLNLTGRSCWVALSIQLQHEKKTTMIYRVNVPSKSCLIRFFSKDLQPRNPSSRLLYWTVQRDPRHFAVQGYQETSVTSGQLCIYIYMYITCYKSYLPLGLVSNILSRSKSSRSGLVFSKAPPTESETISSVTLNHGFPQKRKTCVSHTTHFTSRPSSVSFKHVCLTLIRTC